MDNSMIMWLAGGVAAVLVLGTLLWLFTQSKGKASPAKQAQDSAILTPQKDVTQLGGERYAAPFAEQIEDLILTQIAADPRLAGTKFDLGTLEDGSLGFWVNEQLYHSVAELPDEKLRQIVRQAVARWQG